MLLTVGAPLRAQGRSRGAAAPSKARPFPSRVCCHASPRAGCRPLLAPSPAPRAAPRRRGSGCIAAVGVSDAYLGATFAQSALTGVVVLFFSLTVYFSYKNDTSTALFSSRLTLVACLVLFYFSVLRLLLLFYLHR